MADDDLYDDDGNQIQSSHIRKRMKDLEAKANEAEALKTELAKRDLDLAFARAGVPDDGVGALLRRAYDGDPNPEAIRAEAAKYGIAGFSSAPANDGADDELAALRAAQSATSITNGEANISPDILFRQELDQAKTAAEAQAIIAKFQAQQPGMFVRSV